MLFEKNMKLSDVIHHDYNLVPVISRFGIFLGFGDGTIEHICKEKDININFFLVILNSFHDSKYLNKKYLQNFQPSLLIEYLRKTHNYYLNNKIPEIENLISLMYDYKEINKQSHSLLQKFFNEYKIELIKHIEREEHNIYPLVLDLEKAIDGNKVTTNLLSTINSYPISSYLDEHENVEEKLTDLKNILIKYLPPSTEAMLPQRNRYKLVKELFVLEKDLADHGVIEDTIMVPKVKLMELQVKQIAEDNE